MDYLYKPLWELSESELSDVSSRRALFVDALHAAVMAGYHAGYDRHAVGRLFDEFSKPAHEWAGEVRHERERRQRAKIGEVERAGELDAGESAY